MKAKLNHLHIAPRKVRLMAHLVKGMAITTAERELLAKNKRSALPLSALIRSAAANASHNFQLGVDSLYIKDIAVNSGPVLKRMRPRAFGRGAVIRKRTSHVILTIGAKNDSGAREIERRKDQLVLRDADEGDAGQARHPRQSAKKTLSLSQETPKRHSKGFVKRMFRRKAI